MNDDRTKPDSDRVTVHQEIDSDTYGVSIDLAAYITESTVLPMILQALQGNMFDAMLYTDPTFPRGRRDTALEDVRRGLRERLRNVRIDLDASQALDFAEEIAQAALAPEYCANFSTCERYADADSALCAACKGGRNV